MILAVLRRWRFFGAYMAEARVKLHPTQRLLIAINEQGVHLLSDTQLVSIDTAAAAATAAYVQASAHLHVYRI